MRCLGCAGSGYRAPGQAPALVGRRRGAAAQAAPRSGQAALGMQVSALTAAPLILCSLFLIMGSFYCSSWRACLPSTLGEGEGCVCVL